MACLTVDDGGGAGIAGALEPEASDVWTDSWPPQPPAAWPAHVHPARVPTKGTGGGGGGGGGNGDQDAQTELGSDAVASWWGRLPAELLPLILDAAPAALATGAALIRCTAPNAIDE